MPGNANSGNRGGPRGRPLQRRYTLSAPAAILLRELARETTGEKSPTQEQLTKCLEACILQAADKQIEAGNAPA